MYSQKQYFKPGIKLGVLGGGQLGLMLGQAAISYGIAISYLDPDPEASCKPYSSGFVVGSFKDEETVYNFGKEQEIITIEIEHVNIKALFRLEKEGVKVFPQARIIELIQDKGLQKQFLLDHNFPTAPFRFLDSKNNLIDKENIFPGVLKSRKGGYDGRGVVIVKNQEQILDIIEGSFPEGACIFETMAPINKEISVLVARNSEGEIQVYDPVEMEFNSKANLVEFLIAPARISEKERTLAMSLAQDIIEKLDMVGLLAVEMFLLKNGEIWINELAPRPHNSGHHTIESCYTSQYDQHLRSVLNLPLGSTQTRTPSVMLNLLGEPGYSGPAVYKGMENAMKMKGVFIHLYGKALTRPMRKMGHITLIDPDLEHAYEQAKIIQKELVIIS